MAGLTSKIVRGLLKADPVERELERTRADLFTARQVAARHQVERQEAELALVEATQMVERLRHGADNAWAGKRAAVERASQAERELGEIEAALAVCRDQSEGRADAVLRLCQERERTAAEIVALRARVQEWTDNAAGYCEDMHRAREAAMILEQRLAEALDLLRMTQRGEPAAVALVPAEAARTFGGQAQRGVEWLARRDALLAQDSLTAHAETDTQGEAVQAPDATAVQPDSGFNAFLLEDLCDEDD